MWFAAVWVVLGIVLLMIVGVIFDVVRRAQNRSQATATYGSELQQASTPQNDLAVERLRSEVLELRARVERLENLGGR